MNIQILNKIRVPNLWLFILNAVFIPLHSVQPNKAKSKIAIISLYDDGYSHIGQYSDWNKKAYAKKHGYDLYVFHELIDHTRPAAWSKIPAIEKVLDDYEWIYWSDADSLVMNSSTRLESIIDNNFDMIITRETYGWKVLNTGSFLIRNCTWSKNLLKEIYKKTDFIDNATWEQAAFVHLLKTNPALNNRIKVVNQKVMNSHIIRIFTPGDFVLHFYGSKKWLKKETGLDKPGLMKKYYDKSLNYELQPLFHYSEERLDKLLHDLTQLEDTLVEQWHQYYEILSALINQYNLKVGCEIGVGFGTHAEYILDNTKVIKLFCIDPYTHFDQEYKDQMNLPQDMLDILYFKVYRRLDVFNERYELIRNTSSQATQHFHASELDFVFLDANHAYEQVIKDLENWYTKVRSNGLIAGHGFNKNFPQVKQAVKKFFESKKIKINHDSKERIWWVIKP